MKWLDRNNQDYTYVSGQENPVPKKTLQEWINKHGLETVLNKRSKTWRESAVQVKENVIDVRSAAEYLSINPKALKRPVLITKNEVVFGFKPDRYSRALVLGEV